MGSCLFLCVSFTRTLEFEMFLTVVGTCSLFCALVHYPTIVVCPALMVVVCAVFTRMTWSQCLLISTLVLPPQRYAQQQRQKDTSKSDLVKLVKEVKQVEFFCLHYTCRCSQYLMVMIVNL